MTNAKAQTPGSLFRWDKQRRTEWEQLRNRQLHRAYITPVVPGDWLNLVKTEESASHQAGGMASIAEADEARDVLAALSSIGDRLRAHRQQLDLTGHRGAPPNTQPAPKGAAPKESQSKPAAVVSLQIPGAQQHSQTMTNLETLYKRPTTWGADQGHQPVHQPHPPLTSRSEPRPPVTGRSTTSTATIPTAKSTPRRRGLLKWSSASVPTTAGKGLSLNGLTFKAIQSDNAPTKSKLISKGAYSKRLRPRSRTSMNSMLSSASFNEGHRNSTPKVGSSMLPVLDMSSPLVRQTQYTPGGGDDGWETEPDDTLNDSTLTAATTERRRRGKRRRSRKERPSREPTEMSLTGSKVDFVDTTSDQLRHRDQRRKTRDYDSSRATSALPPPEAEMEAEEGVQPTPLTSRTMSSMEFELPAETPSQATTLPYQGDGSSMQAASSVYVNQRDARRSTGYRPESPEWEDEDLDRTTVSRGTSRDTYRNLDPVSKRRLENKKNKLYRKLQLNIVKKRYDKIH